MSEFKFACPVCGQHMMCDASQGGQVMTCPTCFQQITAPQAPAVDGKFILTGTKVSEKKISAREFAVAPVGDKKFPWSIMIGVVLAVGVAVFIFRGKILSYIASAPANVLAFNMLASNVVPKTIPVAPPASDLNWTLALDGIKTPNGAIVGRIRSHDFMSERATYQNGLLTLRAGEAGLVEFGVSISFAGLEPKALAENTINVRPVVKKAATVNLFWKDAGGMQKQSFNTGYALRLEFGALGNDHLPGAIYLCLPDAEKSYLMGNFNAEVIKPKPAAPSP